MSAFGSIHLNESVIGNDGGVGQTIASDPFVTLFAGVSLALRNR